MANKYDFLDFEEPTAKDLAEIEQEYDVEKMQRELFKHELDEQNEKMRQQEELKKYAKWFKG